MTTAHHTWRDEALDQARGFSGGLLFGIPLLYTMEVWWVGTHADPLQMAALLATTFAMVAALIRVAGFRLAKDTTLRETLMDATEAVAMGLFVSLLVLVVIREATAEVPPAELLGKVIYHAITASIGVALAGQFFRDSADAPGAEDEGERSQLLGTVIDLGATAIGVIFVVSAIAPTDEIPMLVSASTPGSLLVIVAVSLLASYCVVFVSGFSREEQRHAQVGVLQHPVTETIAAYIVTLVVCGLALVMFQRIELADPWFVWLPHIVLLGLPGAIGGAAGRLAV